MTATTTIHCFEEAGLGKAPFRYVGIVDQNIAYGERVIGNVGGCALTTKPGGTCDYCGTYIVNMFRVESADGKTFKVGCECIRKTGDDGLIRRVNDDVRKMERARRQAKKVAKIAADKEYCNMAMLYNLGTLSGLPHPTPYRAAQGESLACWARWMFDNGHYSTLASTLRAALAK